MATTAANIELYVLLQIASEYFKSKSLSLDDYSEQKSVSSGYTVEKIKAFIMRVKKTYNEKNHSIFIPSIKVIERKCTISELAVG